VVEEIGHISTLEAGLGLCKLSMALAMSWTGRDCHFVIPATPAFLSCDNPGARVPSELGRDVSGVG